MVEGIGGKPLKFKTVEELQDKIDSYFKSCLRPLMDKSGNIVRDDNDEIIMVQFRPYTITGLALSLDTSRETLLDYQAKDEYSDTVIRAKRKCEQYAEERLFDRDGANGAKFNLINNYSRWKDKSESEVYGKNGQPILYINNAIAEKNGISQSTTNDSIGQS